MTVFLHNRKDTDIKRLSYATVPSLMRGRWGPKHVTVDVLQHYCDSDELCAFAGLYRVRHKSVNTPVRHTSFNTPSSHERHVVRKWLAVYSGWG